MYTITTAFTIMAALAAAAPAPSQSNSQDLTARGDKTDTYNGMLVTISDAGSNEEKKRDALPEIRSFNGMNVTISDLTEAEKRSTSGINKRDSDYVSSCGPKSGWIPIANHYSGGTGTKYWGYESTVNEYCARITQDREGNPLIVSPGKKASSTVRYQYDSDSSGTRVALKNEVPGHIEFEIHNKQDDGDVKADENSCKEYLMKMADTSSDCYGDDNKDTKGGTWQVGDSKISWHALPASN